MIDVVAVAVIAAAIVLSAMWRSWRRDQVDD